MRSAPWVSVVWAVVWACSAAPSPNTQGGSGGAGGLNLGMDGGPAGGCKNLECQQQACANGSKTELRGTVYAPNGTLPLYNALVYVPNAELPDLPAGPVCDRCGTLPAGEPVVAAVSDASGAFKLTDVPVGDDIPLVIQVGKWRRRTTIAHVPACQTTTLTDPELTRLPRNRGEGSLPRIAVTTGACDNLMCLIPRLGIDSSEIGIAGDERALTFYAGGPSPPDPALLYQFDAHMQQMKHAETLWQSPSELARYDMLLLSCECGERLETKGPSAYAAITSYLALGGRLFGTDYQYVWYPNSTDPNLRAAVDVQGMAPQGTSPIQLDTSFPKGKDLADWLAHVEPSLPYGEVSSDLVLDNFIAATRPAAQIWGTSTPIDGTAEHPRILTLNTPAGLPAAQQCGRAVHVDAHVTSMLTPVINAYPADCGSDLQLGEEVLAFFFFDAAACIQDENKPIAPPVIPK